jgi:MoxR-like ATPase
MVKKINFETIKNIPIKTSDNIKNTEDNDSIKVSSEIINTIISSNNQNEENFSKKRVRITVDVPINVLAKIDDLLVNRLKTLKPNDKRPSRAEIIREIFLQGFEKYK